ncbi:hypothetical protein [Salinisphaera orenii]|uniref:hypothetical protein n=1 Tax=Salinisphaera orenii TaxID=856731 RepID=UPI000DBE128B
MSQQIDCFANTKKLADFLGFTPRRVRQLAEEDVLIRVGRGQFHITQSIYASVANKILDGDKTREADPMTLTAAGWLRAFAVDGSTVTKSDRERWRALCAECRYGAPEAALANAMRLLGNNAPIFS